MIKGQKEADNFPLKQEGGDHHNSSDHEKAKAPSSSSSLAASQWSRLKDPRIVRVSRAFGGKDRHSKVCTIRGLRDRRVRLSVPTAIQLYDLQDRLGLSQPSKVVDWLLNAAKHEIDELPPLPNILPPGNNYFPFNFPSSSVITSSNNNAASSSTTSLHQPNNEQLLNINSNIQWDGFSGQNSIWKLKPKEVSGDMVSTDHHDKANYWMNRSEDQGNNKQGSSNEGPSGAHVFPNNNNLLQRANHPSFLGLLNTMPLGYQWEPSHSIDVNNSQLGINNHGFTTNQTDHTHSSINVIPLLPSTLSLSTGNSSSQLLASCPPPGAATTQSYFPSHHHVTAMEMDQRQINHYHQMLSSAGSSLNPSFSLAMMTPKQLLHSPANSNQSPSNKDQEAK